MTDVDPAADLDTLFGYGELPVGLGNLTLKVRVMLTRKQVRASAQLQQRMLDVHKKFVALEETTQTAASAGELLDVTDEAEALEEQLADICIKALNILCIKPPVEILEQMQIGDLAGLCARVNVEQGELAARAITGRTAHPTSASSGS